MLPIAIPKEKFEKKIMPALSEQNLETVTQRYHLLSYSSAKSAVAQKKYIEQYQNIETTDLYVLDKYLPEYEVESLYQALYSVYTQEDFVEDNRAAGGITDIQDDTVSFTSAEYYRCDTDLLHAGYNIPPWDNPPESSRLIRSTELFRGKYYESKPVSGQQFLSGKLVIICNTTQLKNYLADYPYAYADKGGHTLDISRFTDSYFRTRSIVLTTYDLQNYNYDFSVNDDIRVDGGTLYINTAMTLTDDLPSTTYIAHDLSVYEIDRAELQNITELQLY